MPVWHAEDGMELQPRHFYLAPPDQHLLINRDGTASLAHRELEVTARTRRGREIRCR